MRTIQSPLMPLAAILGSSLLIFAIGRPSAYGQGAVGPRQVGSAFVVTPSQLFIASQMTLSCIGRNTGRKLWSQKTPYGSIDSGPLIEGDNVFYSGGGGGFTIYGVDEHTGKVKWSRRHRSLWLAVGPGILFADNDPASGVTAFSTMTGRTLWSFEGVGPGSIGKLFYYRSKLYAASYVLDSNSGRLVEKLPSSPRAFAASGRSVFLLNADKTLEARDADTGRLIWSVDTPATMSPIAIATATKYVFAVFYQGQAFFASQGTLIANEASDGRKVWETPLVSSQQSLYGDPLNAGNGDVYIVEPFDRGGKLQIHALDARTGRLQWSTPVSGALPPPALDHGRLYIKSGTGTLLTIDAQTGRLLGTIDIPE